MTSNLFRQHGRPTALTRGVALAVCFTLQALPMAPAFAAPGGVVRNGSNTGIAASGFLFEPEVPFVSLKAVPIWNELEQLLDNPYGVTVDPLTPGNDQGFPSYRATGVLRRPGFGVTLPHLLVHPLNYNTTTGEEMRLLNPLFPETPFSVINEMVEGPIGTFTWTRETVTISAGAARVGESSIDYNNPVGPDAEVCVSVTELFPPEGSLLCGGDPGEPRYYGFGRINTARDGYSTPAVPTRLAPAPALDSTIPIAGGALAAVKNMLFDPTRIGNSDESVDGYIPPRNPTTGRYGLRKPSLRIPQNGGTPAKPNYTLNTNPDEVVASTENDYIRDRNAATVLGKAFFWDMQVGSDGVQSCGTCHFNGTGTDTRTKNQLNPNHLGADNTLQIGDSGPVGDRAANYQLKASDFPLHNLFDPNIAGDPLCKTGYAGKLEANVSAIPYLAQTAGYQNSQRFSNPVSGIVTVCDAANIKSDTNDVVSSMGVVFSPFSDIAAIGAFQPAANGVQAVMPDLRTANAIDPIPAFQGFRRVEPRNTPTMQAAGFNFDNFWDGRARHDFNGGSVFGAADPQTHVFACASTNGQGTGCTGSDLVPTRQIIRFVSVASLATGPGLSEFEMSFIGRNWSKIAKKLLQSGVDPLPAPNALRGTVTPLANQLVATTDSVLGVYSNQGGSLCGGLQPNDRSPGSPAAGKPGLCISYPGLIRKAFYPGLWDQGNNYLIGCYTDGNATLHPNQCGTTSGGVTYPAAAIKVLDTATGLVASHNSDPFDGYVLSIGNPARKATRTNTNEFTQMEANFSLFWGLAVQTWVNILVPDDTPFDQFLDRNAGAFLALGEPGEPGLVADLLNCGQTGADPNYCFTPLGNFKRDPLVVALQTPTGEGGTGGVLVASGGTRQSSDPDPLLGLDIFFASNLSLKNPNFRTGRCGECHAIPTLTDHTMPFTSKINLMDAVAEFATPGIELIVEPLARLRVITGFLLESELAENGQDAVERRFVDQSLIPHPTDGLAYPGGLRNPDGSARGNDNGPILSTIAGDYRYTGADAAFLDNGVYNLGVRPIHEDLGRGGLDAFNWPLSLTALMMKNIEGTGYNPGGDVAGPELILGTGLKGFPQPTGLGNVMARFDPDHEEGCFGLFEPNAQDWRINPGCNGELEAMQLPAYLGAFANNITVGDFPPEMDEAGGAIGGMVNTLTDVSLIEGFMDNNGPFNPANIAAEVLNFGGFSDRPGDVKQMMGTWPNVNRVGRMGSFKAPQLRSIELTGPYFHNGGKLTLRQVVDFYTRGGDFPITNSAHRDFNLVNMNIEIQSNLSEEEKTALVDFLLELTDERNRFAKAPFDHPQVIVPIDGLAPDNTAGRLALLANPMFMDVNAVGAAGRPNPNGPPTLNTGPEPTFMNVTKVRVSGADANPGSAACNYATGVVSHYCH